MSTGKTSESGGGSTVSRRAFLGVAMMGAIGAARPRLTRGPMIAMMGGGAPKPSMVDIFEAYIYKNSDGSIGLTTIPVITVVAGGSGTARVDDYEYEFSLDAGGTNLSWPSFTGQNAAEIGPFSRQYRSISFNGRVKWNIGFVVFFAGHALYVTSLRIPSWMEFEGVTTSKPFTNCTDITFVNRTYSQALSMADSATMRTVFANAIWHCSDGDYHADGTNTT